MMTYSQPVSNYNYGHFPLSTRKPTVRKNLAAEPKYFGSSADTATHGPYSTSGANPRTLPPYISVQRASEPASPATIATTISSTHSTPSPSPSRLPTLPATATHDSDFTLFDDAIVTVDQDITGNASKGRVGIDVPSTMSDGNQNLNSYSSAGFPIIVPHDGPYPNYTQSGLYNNYASGGFPSSDTNGNMYTFNHDDGVTQSPLEQLASNKLLHPSSRNSNGNMGRHSGQVSSHDVESLENVPALSPTSKQSSRLSPNRKNRPSSPLSPTARIANQNSGFPAPNYLHSAMPKLGRTFSDAAQDELYNPDLSRQASFNPTHLSAKHQQQSSKLKPSQLGDEKNENRTSLPQIFQEAQQQHEQTFYRSGVHDLPPRDQSPFRHNSPFHPTNTVYPSGYNGQTQEIPDNAIRDEISRSQLAIALAMGEQMQKGSQQPSAPKTISPRDSLLEYNEPENSSNHLNLFPPLPSGRVVNGQQDINGPGSIQGSQDGSDLDDFQSMATSRRGSIANSSASSHLEVPRYSMIQPSYDPSSTSSYYYTDSTAMGNALPIMDQHFLKSEPTYNPIPRPLETSANTGTYTCTYSGCGHRFTTSTKLQKHRREAHRKTAPSGNSVSTAAAIASRNAQPGPHRCMRVNPSTGKPCNTVFSRPYDLTRHEDTIHNSAKAKVRCEICNDDKTFSRGDALVRHRRVKHNIS